MYIPLNKSFYLSLPYTYLKKGKLLKLLIFDGYTITAVLITFITIIKARVYFHFYRLSYGKLIHLSPKDNPDTKAQRKEKSLTH